MAVDQSSEEPLADANIWRCWVSHRPRKGRGGVTKCGVGDGRPGKKR